MAKSENQRFKILYLLKIFEEETDSRHRLSMSDLIERLSSYGVSAERKSIYSDITVLTEMGYDISYKKGGPDSGYCLDSRNFQPAELKLLVDSVQSSRFITKKKSDELIRKLEKLCSTYEAKMLQRQVFVADRVKTMNEDVFENVDRLHEAINKNRRITFRYWNWNMKKKQELRHDGALYLVSPWGLCWDSENYYMIAFDSVSQKIKHYRVDKMQEISITDDKREGLDAYKGINMAEYSRKTFGMFGGEERPVTMECDPSLAGVMIDRFGKDSFIVPKGDRFTITVKVAVSGQFLGWVAGLGSGVRITAPADVAAKMRELLQGVLENY